MAFQQVIRSVIRGDGAGGTLRAKVVTAAVPLTAGLLATVSRFGLLAPVAFAKTAGNANLTISTTGGISATTALAEGASQSLSGTVTGADGCVVPFAVTLTGVVPTPAPVFTVQPTISGTAQIGQTLTGMDGTITNGVVVSRRWLLGETAVSAAGVYLATAAGQLVFEVTATGAGGTTVATSAPVDVAAVSEPSLSPFVGAGANLGYEQLDYGGTGFPFLDRSKSGGQWLRGDNADLVQINADGYPTAIPAGQTFIQCLYNTEGPLGPPGVPQRYVLETTKTDAVFEVAEAGNAPNAITEIVGGKLRFTYTTNAPFNDQGGYRYRIKITSLPTPFVAGVDTLTICRVDEEADFKAGKIFSPQFLARFIGKYAYFRMMDWWPVNRVNVSTWAQRPRVAYANWNESTGVPLEIMIALCNQTGLHLYANIPVTADDNYIDQTALMIDDLLDDHLQCGLEAWNEAWNDTFPQFYYLRDFEPPIYGDGNSFERPWTQHGYQMTRKLARFIKAVGFSKRFRLFWATQAVDAAKTIYARYGVKTKMAEWANPQHPNYDAALAARYDEPGKLFDGGLGLTSYADGGMARNTTTSADISTMLAWAAMGDQGIANGLRQLEFGDLLTSSGGNSTRECIESLRANIALADAMGMPWYCYEGNIDLIVTPLQTSDANKAILADYFARLMAAPATRGLYFRYQCGMRSEGAYLNTVLADIGRPGVNTYGTQLVAYGPPTPRMLALADFAADPGPARPLTVTTTTSGPTAVGTSPDTRIVPIGGVGRRTVTISGTLVDGRHFDGFLNVRGAFTAENSDPVNYTVHVVDEAGTEASLVVPQVVLPPFNPLALTAIEEHRIADQGVATGGGVFTWTDQKHGRVATAGDQLPSLLPNGWGANSPAIQLGVGKWLDTTTPLGGGSFTLFMVVKEDAVTGGYEHTLVGTGHGGVQVLFASGILQVNQQYVNYVVNPGPGIGNQFGIKNLLVVRWDDTTKRLHLRLNGSTLHNDLHPGVTFPAAPYRIGHNVEAGGNQDFVGLYKCFTRCSAYVSDGEVMQMEAWVKENCGTA